MKFNLIDIIILILIVILLVIIGYFYLWKNRKKPCHNCPYAKKCNGNCHPNENTKK